MSRYIGQNCPVCNEQFDEKSDVVVCPECGAPHHRECYKQKGECFYKEHHGTENGYIPPEPKEEEPSEEQEKTRRCAKCGALNPIDNNFCDNCGEFMRKNHFAFDLEDMGTVQILIDPYGGVAPDTDIDGVTAQEIALFVGQNSRYYIPKFKELAENKHKICWNWSACAFTFLYFAGRKIKTFAIGIAIVIFALILAGNIPIVMQFGEVYADIASNPEILKDAQARDEFISQYELELPPLYYFINNIAKLVYFVVLLVCGLFADKIYKSYVISKIKKIKEQFTDDATYKAELFKQGGFSTTSVKVALIVYVLVMIAVVVLLSIIALALYM